MTAAPKRALPGATPRLLPEAQRLYNLLSDGHPRLRFAMSRGCPLRDAETRKPLLNSYVGYGEWRAAWNVHGDGTHSERWLNPYVLRKHLIGDYDVATESPSWTSTVVFDIDRHLPEGMKEEDADPWLVKFANEERDETLIRLFLALNLAEKAPVVLGTPRGGYHIYLPVSRGEGQGERTWPAAWLRERVIDELNRHGLGLQPGKLELFPSGTRLRAPCGQGMTLLDNESMEPREGTFNEQRRSRRVGPMVTQFCDAMEAGRKPLEEWLGGAGPYWDRAYGPFGRKKSIEVVEASTEPSRHKVDVQTRLCPMGGLLLFGREFVARVQALARDGLVGEGERHDAVLKLVWYWAICLKLDESEVMARLERWLESHDHRSHLLPARPRKFFQDSLREGVHYLRHRLLLNRSPGHARLGSRRTDVTPPVLAVKDESVLGRVSLEVRDEVRAILRFLANHADRSGRVPHPVALSGTILAGMCGERRLLVDVAGVRKRRRAYVVAMEHLVELGVLALHTNYSTGRHGKLYTCWYQFGTGSLPAAVTDADDAPLVLAERKIEEGRLVVLSDGPRPPVVRLFAEPSPTPGAKPRRRPALAPAPTDDASPGQLTLPGIALASEPLPEPGGCPLAVHRSAAPVEPQVSAPAATSSPPPNLGPPVPLDDPGQPLPWWVRMYQRRAFTPCEFYEADDRRVIPGPFTHRFGKKKVGLPTLYPGPGPGRFPTQPPTPLAPSAPLPGPEPSSIPPEAAMLPPGALRNAVIAAWAGFYKANPNAS